MRKIVSYLIVYALIVNALISCVSEVVPEHGMLSGNAVTLKIPDVSDVNVYSVAAPSENYINDCIVLAFRGATPATSAPDNSEVVDVSKILNNGSATPILPQLTFVPQAGDRLYVICNTGQTTVPAGLAENNIDARFSLSVPGVGGDNIPMYGLIDGYSATAVCVMTRAEAKVQVKMGVSVPDNTADFTLENVTYQVVNFSNEGYITAKNTINEKTNLGSAGATYFKLLQTDGERQSRQFVISLNIRTALMRVSGLQKPLLPTTRHSMPVERLYC